MEFLFVILGIIVLFVVFSGRSGKGEPMIRVDREMRR